MITISNKSWHHKLYRMGCDNTIYHYQLNLCHYINRVLLGVLKILLVISAMGLALFGLGGFVYFLFKVERISFTYYTYYTFIIHLILVSIIALIVLYKRKKINISLPRPKSISLFSAWISAKKQRICPLIEIVDDANTTDIL